MRENSTAAANHMVDVLEEHVAARGHRPAYTFLAKGERAVKTLTFADLDRRARAVATVLRQHASGQARALMVYSSGLEFVEAFWACFYARMIAVPAYPPRSNISGASRLHSIVEDCAPELVLCTREHFAEVEPIFSSNAIPIVVTDEISDDAAQEWRPAEVRASDLALLQYSSGSTASPRGVIVTHANILANQVAVKQAFRHSKDSTFVGWLPFFHDMGLFGQIVQPLFLGTHSVMMPPAAFIQKPVRWLRAISDYRGHTSGGPNFAYEYCVRKISEEEKEGLDLSCWKRAFNGAEKPRPETMRRFASAFSRCGFRQERFYPCYGLAECVLFVAGRDTERSPGIAEAAPPAAHGPVSSGVVIASSGRSWLEHRIAIVDPKTHTRCADGTVGEIWVHGPSVAGGYWGKPDLTKSVFHAFLTGSNDGPFVRTGDLGFMREEQLFISGRLKDLVILRGQNYHPEDIEAAIENACEELGAGQCAAFSIDNADGEQLAVVIEVQKQLLNTTSAEALAAKTASAVSLNFGISISRMLIVRRGAIPKTTSNKIQRFRCREMLLADQFNPFWSLSQTDEADRVETDNASVLAQLLPKVAAVCRRTSISSSASLSQNGLDSISALELKQWIGSTFGVELPLSELFDSSSIEDLADTVGARVQARNENSAIRSDSPPDGSLSYGQQALLYEYEKDPASSAHNIAVALRLTGRLSGDRLSWAVRHLIRTHEQLSAIFFREAGEARYKTSSTDAERIGFADASSWTEAELIDRVSAEANRAFDLRKAAFRCVVFAAGERSNVLLLTAHHIVIDLFSLEILLRDVIRFYDEQPSALEPSTSKSKFYEFVRWEAAFVSSERGEQSLEFWRNALSGSSLPPRLPLSRATPADTHIDAGGEYEFAFTPAETASIRECAARAHTTTAMVLLAGYTVLLTRAAHTKEMIVGVSAIGRPDQSFSNAIGYFVNILPLPLSVEATASFEQVLSAATSLARRALDHQHYPYAQLVEQLAVGAKSAPLVRYAFTYEEQHSDTGYAGLLHEDPSVRISMGELIATGFPLHRQMAPFELTLIILERQDRLHACFCYADPFIETHAIPEFAAQLRTLLSALVTRPAEPIQQLSIEPVPAAAVAQRAAPPKFISFVERFEHHAHTHAASIALTHREQHVSYYELNRRADCVARYLRSLGAKPESVIAVHCPRGTWMIVAILGVVKAGAAYLPIDVRWPAERIRMVMKDAGATLALTVASHAEAFSDEGVHSIPIDAGWREIEAAHPAFSWSASAPDNLAYIIYTSGSTGMSKGVGISYSNFSRLFDAAQECFEFGRNDTWSLFHSISFDFSVWEMWGALCHGGRLHILDYEDTREPERVYAELLDHQVTVLNLVPTAFYSLLPVLHRHVQRADALMLRYVVLGGEALQGPAAQRWFDHPCSSRAALVNMYGITETTVHVTWVRLEGRDLAQTSDSPIGRPLPDLAIHILNSGGHLLPPWALGEIAVCGAGVARGYHRRPALTAQRFVPDPYSGAPSSRLYLSGDLGYDRGAGQDLVYSGRLDTQMKMRGHRIEPGEIEAAARAYSGVEWTHACLVEDSGGAALTLFVVCGDHLTAASLREHLARVLPEYMIPAKFIRVREVPLTENGKLDTGRLRACTDALRSGEDYAAPRTEAELAMAAVWAEVLGIERVGIDDEYFALGGDSIRSIRVVARARALNLPLELWHLLRYRTIRRIFDNGLAAAGAEALAPSRPFDLVQAPDARRLPNSVQDAFPVSRILQGLMFHSQFSDDYQVYVTSLRIEAAWHADALSRAIQAAVRRHSFLRSSFDTTSYSEPLQLVQASVEVPVSFEDLTDCEAQAQERLIQSFIEAEKNRRFDWSCAPLIRFTVHRRANVCFQITLADAYLDGWCVALLFREILETYAGLSHGHGHESGHEGSTGETYRRFVELEIKALADSQTIRFWKQYLENCPASLISRVNFTRAAAKTWHSRKTLPVGDALVNGLRAVADQAGVPLRTVVLASHAYALSRILERDEITFGIILNGRPEIHGGDEAIGNFLNVVAMRLSIRRDDSWIEFTKRVFEAECAIIPYRRFPFAEVKKIFSHDVPFDTVFNFTHFHALDPARGAAYRIADMFASEQTFFPFTVHFNRSVLNLESELLLDYNCQEISAAEVEHIGEIYTRILDAVARISNTTISELDEILCPRAAQATHEIPATASGSVITLIEQIAAASPDAIALVADGAHITYRQMQASADRLADHLVREAGLGPNDVVGLHAKHSAAAIVGILALLRTGAGWVPIDEDCPPERIAFILEDCAVTCVLTEQELECKIAPYHVAAIRVDRFLRGAAPVSEPLSSRPAPSAGDLAYVIYTSGTTGSPKGAAIEHGSLANLAGAAIKEYRITPRDRILQFCTLEFDISVEEIFMCLCAGATLVLRSADLLQSYEVFENYCVREAVTCLNVPTAFWVDWAQQTVTGSREMFDIPLRMVIIAGEAMPPELAWSWKKAVAPTVALVNTYGPTEATVKATIYEVDPGSNGVPMEPTLQSPIGRGFGNTAITIVDTLGRPVGSGVYGELYIGGPCVAREYRNRPALTADRFKPDPTGAPGSRRYRTGDIAFYDRGHNIYFVGRLDLQVKIRGYRVELQEIEAALAQCPEVRQAVVAAGETERGAAILKAFIVLADDAAVDRFASHESIVRQLEKSLPGYMIPAEITFLESLPTTTSGKIDRRLLIENARACEGSAVASETADAALVETVIAAFKDCLHSASITCTSDFFSLGGDSLVAMRLASRLRAALDCEVSVRDILENSGLGRLADLLSRRAAEAQHRLESPASDASEPVLSFAQERLWVAEQLSTSVPSYNIPAAITIRGGLDSCAFEQALREVQRRHAILQTRIVWYEGRPTPIRDESRYIELARKDLTALAEETRNRVLNAQRSEYVTARFDLEQELPLRVALFKLNSCEHQLVFVIHHIAADAWSVEVLIRELLTLYSQYSSGQPSTLPELPIQYSEFARRQKEQLRGARKEQLAQYWAAALDGMPDETRLPSDRPRPTHNGYRGARYYFNIDPNLAAAVGRFSRGEGVTMFTVLLTAYKALLHASSGQTDLVVATPVSKRDWTDTEGLIGLFVNQLVIRTDLSGALTYRAALRRVRSAVLSAYDHRDLPFEDLVSMLRPRRKGASAPLIQTVFAYRERPWNEFRIEGLELEFPDVHNGAVKSDLEVQIAMAGAGGMRGYLEFNVEMFQESTIRVLAEAYRLHLRTLVEEPDRALEMPAAAPVSALEAMSTGALR